MSDADPLARERFRTILLGPIEAEANLIYEGGGSYADEAVVADLIGQFPEAYFERRTNDNGVRMRRVVVISEWEVDPMPAVEKMPEPCETCDDMGCAECEPLSSGRCTDPACSAAHIPNHSHLTQAGQQAALAEVMDALRER